MDKDSHSCLLYWKKYHLVPDSLENLQSQFHFLKEDTSRNIENLQHSVTVQQTYTANLCTYINNILPHITKLEDAIHKLNQKLTTEPDTIQINTPDFDPDIDGPNIPRAHNNTAVVSVQDQLTSPEPELSDATNFQEKNTDRNPLNATCDNSEESHGHDIISQYISNHTQYIIPRDNTRTLQDTTSIQKKSPTRRGLG